MSGKRKQSRSRRKRRSDLHTRLTYVTSVLVLTALVGVAFFAPGWVFGFQDNIRCRDQVLEERENVNVAALSTNYEPSFYQRMANFAEDPAGTSYYVASEELTDYDRLQDFLDSDNGLSQGRIWALIQMGLVTEQIFSCEISEWKQYVIYSDDYTRGVNFILWYIELVHPDETIGACKLLVGAETGEIYGVKADWGEAFFSPEMKYDRDIIYYEHSLEECLGFPSGEMYGEEWALLALFFSGLTLPDFYDFTDMYISVEEVIHEKAYVDSEYVDETVNMQVSGDELDEIKLKLGITDEYDGHLIDFLGTYPAMTVWDKGNRLEYVFPYGDSSLIFRMQMAESVPHPWRLKDITVGFPEIYELIPEFQE